MLDLLAKGTDRGYSMIGVGLSAGLSGSRRARTVQDPLPALDLDWATNRSLPASYGPTPTFTRASTGTYFDGQGILRSAAVNAARFNHTFDGTSWVSRGLLVEEQRTSLLTYSNTFSNGSWTKVRGTVSQDVVGPDGATSGWTATCNETGGGHYAYITPGSGASTSGAYTISVFAKKGNNGLISLQMGDTSYANYVSSYFDLTAATATTPSITGNYSAASAKIENVGSGWYRCSLTATKGSSNGITASVGFSNDSTAGFCTSGQYNYFYNSQLEFGAFPTSAIVTTSAQVTRSADVCQITGSNLASFLSFTEGTFAVEFDSVVSTTSSVGYGVFALSDSGSNLNRMFFDFYNPDNAYRWYIRDDGNSGKTTQLKPGPLSGQGVTTKAAMTYKQNDIAISLNSASVLNGIDQTIPTTLNRLQIGTNEAYGSVWSGHIARLRYYPTRLTNAKLQELST